jgi:uncharacterized protein (TIGR03437 family)
MSAVTFRKCLTIFGLLVAAWPADAQLWDKNLVVNGDAEQGTGVTSTGAAVVASIPGWTTTGNFTLCQFVNGMPTDKRQMVTATKQYFAGGPKGGAATAKQTIDLSSGATEIDAGRVKFYLSAWLSNGGSAVMAASKITATFLDGSGKTLLEHVVNGPVLAETNTSQLLWRSGSGFVLPNTRSVQLVIDLTSKPVTFNGASADNVVLTLALEPLLGTNLVVNGDGEAQTADNVPPGWNSGDLVSMKSNFFKFVEPPLATLGTYMLSTRGGVGAQTGAAYQAIDVTLVKDRIDGNGVKYKLSGLIGGHQDYPDDWTTVKLEFQNAAGKAIGSAVQIGPVSGADRGNKTTFLARSAEGTVPSGTRILLITLNSSVKNGNFGAHVYMDNLSVVLSSGGTVAIKDAGIVNAATGDPGPIAPGEMIMVYTTGVNLASSARTQLDSSGKVSTSIADVRLFFDGTQAPLLSVNNGQVGAVVPFDVDGKANVQVRLEYQGVPSQTVSMGAVSTSPGIFTQDGSPSGVGLIYNSDFTLNSKENPAAEGSEVTIYWTGGGQTDPGGVDGRVELMPLSRPKASVNVAIGGKAADLSFAGGTPYGWAGLLMANAKVPAGIAGDDPVSAPVVITAGSASSPDGKVVMWVKK